MNRSVFVLIAMVATVAASSAGAQVTNYEFDTNPANVPYSISYDWTFNPNVSTPNGGKCYYVPARLNTKRGDTILSAAPNSVIYKLLESLGEQHSHTGMALSSSQIRHNTFFEPAMDLVWAGEIPQYAKPTGFQSLRDGWPGIITQSVEAATGMQEINIPNGLVLHSAASLYGTTADRDYSATLRAKYRASAANMIEDMTGWYRWYAYTNTAWADPFTKAYNTGSMCSNTVREAHRLGKSSLFNLKDYSSSVRQSAAQTLYSTVRADIIDGTSTFEDVILGLNSIFGGTSRGEIATRISNQIVNCMAFNDCGNRTDRWRGGVGTGRSISPDGLLENAALHAFVSAIYAIDTNFVYNASKPVQVTANYYCCTATREVPNPNYFPGFGFPNPTITEYYLNCKVP